MTKATFDKWVAPCGLISVAGNGNGEGIEVRIRCQNAFARDWLTNRLQPIFIRALEGLLGKPVAAVSFEPVAEEAR